MDLFLALTNNPTTPNTSISTASTTGPTESTGSTASTASTTGPTESTGSTASTASTASITGSLFQCGVKRANTRIIGGQAAVVRNAIMIPHNFLQFLTILIGVI